jgi:hypothetical protein
LCRLFHCRVDNHLPVPKPFGISLPLLLLLLLLLRQALSSVLYASARCPELEELVKLRAMFEQKYGKVGLRHACC